MKKTLCLCAAFAATVALAAPAPGVHVGLDLPPGPNNPRNSEGAFMPLKDGRIMFAYSRYYGKSSSDHATADIAARYSSDKGRTWTTNDEIIVKNEGGMNEREPAPSPERRDRALLPAQEQHGGLPSRPAPFLRRGQDVGRADGLHHGRGGLLRPQQRPRDPAEGRAPALRRLEARLPRFEVRQPRPRDDVYLRRQRQDLAAREEPARSPRREGQFQGRAGAGRGGAEGRHHPHVDPHERGMPVHVPVDGPRRVVVHARAFHARRAAFAGHDQATFHG